MKYETMKKVPKRLKKVEELFDIAQETLEECQLPPEPEESTEIEVLPPENSTELGDPVEEGNKELQLPRLFDLSEVRQDFMIARRNLNKLMLRCQNLMDGTEGFNIVEMKSSQVEAVALLANSINMQIQTVVRLYRDLAEIEKLRTPPELRGTGPRSDTKSDAVYIGDSKSLLDIIEENS